MGGMGRLKSKPGPILPRDGGKGGFGFKGGCRGTGFWEKVRFSGGGVTGASGFIIVAMVGVMLSRGSSRFVVTASGDGGG